MSSNAIEMEIREHLMNTNEEFKHLAQKHRDLSQRLEQLAHKPFLTEAERLEEITLKKKKLLLKDQMQAIINRYRQENKI